MNPLLEAALDYVSRGWPVLPLTYPKAGGCSCGTACSSKPAKHPIWQLALHGLKDATTDFDQIREWWAREPDANVGVCTGVGFDVLDVDGDEGWRTLARTTAEYGCLSSSPVSLTGGGGGHYLFLPTGIGNKTGFQDHLDWRGAAGYIVAPPSVHISGVRYEWAWPLDEVPIEAAPAWLVELVGRKAVPKASPGPLAPWVRARPGEGSAYGQAALRNAIARLSAATEGTRNASLNNAALSLGHLVGGGELSKEAVVAALFDAAIALGLGQVETEKTIISGLTAGMAEPKSAPKRGAA